MIQQKVEIRFEKSEAIRFISHHDLMRAMGRAVRRADLPVRLTEGFNPRPRLVLPVALEVGVASLDEVAEIEFTQWLSTQEVFARLSSAFPPGLVLKTVREVPPRRAGQTVRRILYRLHLAEAALTVTAAQVENLLAQTSLPFQRPRERRLQSVDLRPALSELNPVDGGDLQAVVSPGPKGTARPLEILSLLLNQPLQSLRHVRITKLQSELEPAPELTPEALLERRTLLQKEAEANDPP